MKYLVVSPYFWPHIGGSQRYMEELYAHVLKRDPTAKVDIVSYNTNGAPRKENYRGITIYRIPCIEPLPGQYAMANPVSLIQLLIQLSTNTYDVVHANTRFFETTLWAWIFARIVGAQSILTDHVARHPIHPNRTITRIAKFLDVTIFQWILWRYDLVTATNKKTRDFIAEMLGYPHGILTYGGVDTKLFRPAKPTNTRTIPYVRKRFGKNDIVITFAGRLIRTKGILLFLKTIESLIRVIPKRVSFIVAGDGPLADEISALIQYKPLRSRVFTTGALTQLEMKQLFKSTDIFVHPSYHAEGFPNAILEATASGCFVIATKNAGTNEIVHNRITGILIQQRDGQGLKRALWWSITHPKKRKAMAQAGRLWTIKHFDWHMQADKFLSIVQSLYLSPASLQRSLQIS